jgi:transcriptional regulator with XRE-family HTH domain
MTEQSRGHGGGYQFAEPESRFNRHWREMIDRVGTQAQVVNRLGWTKSTVSRDYRGEILPSDERLRQLCDFLGLSRPEHDEILRLLEEARLARQDRKAQSDMATDLSPVI